MKSKDTGYKLISTEDCLKYIVQNGLSLEDENWDYSISSGKGLIYTLPNGEFVLVPSNFDKSYPSIVFNNAESFNEYANKDFFPIDSKHMTWLEAHALDVKNFEVDNTFYTLVMEKKLKLKTPLINIEDFKVAFNKIMSYIKDPLNSKEDKLAVINCYGLAVAEYLIKVKNNKWEFLKQYEMYNPYYYPVILKDGNKIDVITKVHIAVQNKAKNSFELFCGFVGLS